VASDELSRTDWTARCRSDERMMTERTERENSRGNAWQVAQKLTMVDDNRR